MAQQARSPLQTDALNPGTVDPRWSKEWQQHREMLDRVIATLPTYPGGNKGKGIIIGGGGATYFACAMICYQMLRHLGCRLPVEMWYLGGSEMDPLMLRVASEAGLECVDALRIARGLSAGEVPRRLNGWELKSFAVQHSRFREVLYLDADNVPVRNPEFLFDDEAYRKLGAIFWPDLTPAGRGEWIPKLTKELAGVNDRKGCDDPALESGQFLIDKERCWQELMVVRHLSDYSDFWYQRVYGDKDTFWLAWHRLGTDYVKPGGCGWKRPAIQQYAPESSGGGLLFQHACQAKVELAKAQRIPALLYHDVVHEIGIALRRRWHGNIWASRDETVEEKALANGMVGKYLYRRSSVRGTAQPKYGTKWSTSSSASTDRRLHLLPDGKVGEGGADGERRWTLRLLAHDLPLYPYEQVLTGTSGTTADKASQYHEGQPAYSLAGEINETQDEEPTTLPPSSQEKVTLVVVGGGSKRNEIGMMFLRQLPGNEDWHGHWQAHERCEVVLQRLT